MALAMDTGTVKWITQTTAGDAYTVACMDHTPEAMVACPDSNGPDLDFGASPILIRKPDGSRLLAGQKSGWMYALDPDTGAITWKTEVSQGGIVSGIRWGLLLMPRRFTSPSPSPTKKAPAKLAASLPSISATASCRSTAAPGLVHR